MTPSPPDSPGRTSWVIDWTKQLSSATGRVSQRFRLASVETTLFSASRGAETSGQELTFGHWVNEDDLAKHVGFLEVTSHVDLRPQKKTPATENHLRVHLHLLLTLVPNEGSCDLTELEAIALRHVLSPWMALPYARQGLWDACARIGVPQPRIDPMTVQGIAANVAMSKAREGPPPGDEHSIEQPG